MAVASPANAPGAPALPTLAEGEPSGPVAKLTGLLQGLGPTRLLGLVAALGAVVVSLGLLVARLATPDFEILFSKLSPEDSAALVRQLETSGEAFRIADGGSTILVNRARVARLRIAAAEQKLPSRGSIGYELFDKTDPLATTSSLFQMNQARALEGELSRTIAQIAGVESARVHLVIPFRELFSQQTPETRASVVLQLKPNADASKRRVEAVRQLVSSAVKNLHPSRVSIVDTQGNLLARGDGEAAIGASSSLLEQKLDHERRLRNGIERLVEQYVGVGRVRADVTVDLTLASVVRTSETFDPKSRVERSVQTVEEAANRNETRSEQDVSVQQNLPESRGTQPGATRNQENTRRAEETTNFEVSKTSLRETVEPGSIRRISVAVLVDGVREVRADGKIEHKPRSEQEMQALEKIVRSAVGFSSERNDIVEVVNLPFAPPDMPDIREPGLFDFTKDDLISTVETIALLIGVALLVLLVLRPALKTLLEPPKPVEETGLIVDESAGKPPALTATDDVAAMKAEIEREMQELQAKRAESLAEMIDIDKIEGQVQASAVKRITEIVDKHPEEAAQVIRSWLTQRG